jgi:hypothetical protein
MKKQIILFASILMLAGLASAQLPSLSKAKGLISKKNSGTTDTVSNKTTPATTTSTTTTSSKNNATVNTTNSPATDAAATINFSNPTGQKSTTYTDGDAIFAKVDFVKAMKDIGGKQYSDVFIINVFDGTKFLNGKKLDFLKDEDMGKSSFEFQIACSNDQAKSPLAEAFTKTLSEQLGKAKHIIKIKMVRMDKFNNELAVAEGTFDFDLSNGKDKLKAQAYSYDAKEIEARMMPKAVIKNAAIEQDLMALIKNDFQEEIVPLRAVIDDNDWTILRDDYDAISGKKISGYVAFKVPRNGRCFYKKITIWQPYTGGGTYGKSQYYDTGVSTDLMEMKYENVMK